MRQIDTANMTRPVPALDEASETEDGDLAVVIPFPGSEPEPSAVRRQSRSDRLPPRPTRRPRPSRVRGCSRQSSRPTAPGRALRLTRRGRLVGLALLATVVALAAALVVPGLQERAGGVSELGRSGQAEHSTPGAPGSLVGSVESTETVIVQPGETLWEVAQEAVPAADVRITIDRIRKLNEGFDVGRLRPGQAIVVPARNSSQ